MEKKAISPTSNAQIDVNNIVNSIKAPAEWLRAYYSQCLDKDISMRQTWLITQAQIAFILTVFSICPILVRAAFALWFLAALLKCKKEI